MSGEALEPSRSADMSNHVAKINAWFAERHPPKRDASETPSTINKCKRCKHEWLTASHAPTPKTCPKCRSRRWQTPPPKPTPRIGDISRVCMVCGHTWGARKKARPCACPHCHSPNWDKQPITNHCAKCGYTWEARKATPYLSCPSCHSRKWRENTDLAHIKATKET